MGNPAINIGNRVQCAGKNISWFKKNELKTTQYTSRFILLYRVQELKHKI